jgi:hypothetical protein
MRLLKRTLASWIRPLIDWKSQPPKYRSTVLPALRDALVAQHLRTSGDPRIIRERIRVVDVDFIDHAMGDGSNIR